MAGHTSPAKHGGVSGNLILERDTLMFTRTDGFLTKTVRVPIRIPLNAIVTINAEGGLLGGRKLVILTDKVAFPGIPRHEFSVPDPDQWVEVLQTEMSKVVTQKEGSKEEVKVFIKEREIVKIPCRYCGTLIVITESQCSKCGAPLK